MTVAYWRVAPVEYWGWEKKRDVSGFVVFQLYHSEASHLRLLGLMPLNDTVQGAISEKIYWLRAAAN